jgi:hypothetical protein
VAILRVFDPHHSQETPTMKIGDCSYLATIYVFRKHEEWAAHDRWFQMPMNLLRSLFVCVCLVDENRLSSAVEEIERRYPGHVLVY